MNEIIITEYRLEMNVKEVIQSMPKAELHLHLEGAFTFEVLLSLIRKYGGEPGIHSVEDLKSRFVFADFSQFIDTWFWKNSYFREASDVELSTYHTLESLHRQNVIYLEAFYSPWDFTPNGLTAKTITEATLRAIGRAEKDFGIQCGLIADLSRDMGWENAIERFEQIVPYRNAGVIGIGLGGSEQRYPPELFSDVFRYARETGFHCVAHAGEAAGPASIRGALDALGIERIGHGVRAIEDRRLMDRLAEMQIPLEICVTSNIKTGVFPSLKSHPLRPFLDAGLFLTINSDDPAMFGTTLTDEYILLHDQFDISTGAIKALSMNAVRASFLGDSEKTRLMHKFGTFWDEFTTC